MKNKEDNDASNYKNTYVLLMHSNNIIVHAKNNKKSQVDGVLKLPFQYRTGTVRYSTVISFFS